MAKMEYKSQNDIKELCPFTKTFDSFGDRASQKLDSTRSFGRKLIKYLKLGGTSPKSPASKRSKPAQPSQPSFGSQRFLNLHQGGSIPRKDEFDTYDKMVVPPAASLLQAENHYELCKALAKEIIPWWTSKSETLPSLFRLAQFIHAIPASSAPSERVNSYAKIISHDKKGNISPKLMETTLLQKFSR